MAKIAQVYLWDTLLGAVFWRETQAPATGAFEFDAAFTEIGLQVAPLTMPALPNEVYAFPSPPGIQVPPTVFV